MGYDLRGAGDGGAVVCGSEGCADCRDDGGAVVEANDA